MPWVDPPTSVSFDPAMMLEAHPQAFVCGWCRHIVGENPADGWRAGLGRLCTYCREAYPPLGTNRGGYFCGKSR